VARIRLNVFSVDNTLLADQSGGAVNLSFLRLTSIVYLAGDPTARDGLIDTGSALSVFPDAIWSPLAGHIEWLTAPTGQTLAGHWTKVRGLTGGAIPSRLGRIVVTAVDYSGTRLAPVPVVGKFAEDNGTLQRILLGLHGDLFDGRRLIVEPDLREAWLEDR
jgi:hypothetical protein